MTLERALELRAACDYRGALAALATADDAPALLERSRLHEDLGDYAAARADAERVYVLTDGAPSARARLAAVARVERRSHDALLILEGVPGPEALVERAGALEELAEHDEAERLFRSLEPESARLRHAVRWAWPASHLPADSTTTPSTSCEQPSPAPRPTSVRIRSRPEPL